jgi:FKBP-type peptidyl-prolyl cis-trans isomerase (trigger factor)
MANVTIKELDHSEVEIEGSIEAELFDKNRAQAIKNLGANIELQGFRKGHVPENVLEKHLGEHAILQEMAEITIGKEYKNIIVDNKLNPISRPDVVITKMAMSNPLEFKVKVAIMPTITLGDYKKAAKTVYEKQDEVVVTDTEVEETIGEIQRMYAGGQPKPQEDTGAKEDGGTQEEPAPKELDDEFVQGLGDFKDVADFKAKLKENILLEKKHKAADKKRSELLEKIAAETKVDLPHIIIEAEQNKMLAQFKGDVERAGMTFEAYLTQAKKTEEEILNEFEKEAEKRARFQLSLNQIAVDENIKADHDEVHKQVDLLMKQYPDADKQSVHVYVESNLTNQKVFEFLEKTGIGHIEEKKEEKKD